MSEMLTAGPIASIDGPLPRPRPYNLVATAEVVDTGDERWGNAAEIDPYPIDRPSVWAQCVSGSETKPGAEEQPDPGVFLPFGVVLPVFCSAGRGGSYERLQERATRVFTATESHGVEKGFANGIGLSPSLLTATKLNSGTAVRPEVGVGLLEDYIANTSARLGMLHATPKGATLIGSVRSTAQAGTILTTKLGTPIAVGSGYIGVKPNAGATPTADQAWVFATGPVQIRRTEVIIPGDSIAQILDRAVNDVTLYVERNYLVTWDTAVLAAVLIDQNA